MKILLQSIEKLTNLVVEAPASFFSAAMISANQSINQSIRVCVEFLSVFATTVSFALDSLKHHHRQVERTTRTSFPQDWPCYGRKRSRLGVGLLLCL